MDWAAVLFWIVFAVGLFNVITAIVLSNKKQYGWAWSIALADIVFLRTYLNYKVDLNSVSLLIFVFGMVGLLVPGFYWVMKIKKAFKKDGSAS